MAPRRKIERIMMAARAPGGEASSSSLHFGHWAATVGALVVDAAAFVGLAVFGADVHGGHD